MKLRRGDYHLGQNRSTRLLKEASVPFVRPLANLTFLGYTPATVPKFAKSFLDEQPFFFRRPLHCCDVLVIGGGPAGSTISALLAEQGWKVHVLEKDSHPRFHIGESLLPQSVPCCDGSGSCLMWKKSASSNTVPNWYPIALAGRRCSICQGLR